MTVLVTGFGPFPGVDDNPTARIARAVDGRRVGDADVVGIVLPVSYVRGPDLAIETARRVGARLIVGLGVATARVGVEVERVGRRVDTGRADVDGSCDPGLVGPDVVPATADVGQLAAALGATLSDDAGAYVCNAWLYRVAGALEAPVAFVHVPPDGLDPEVLLRALAVLTSGPRLS